MNQEPNVIIEKQEMNINSERRYDLEENDYLCFPIHTRHVKISPHLYSFADIHWHKEFELVLVTSGKMKFKVNDSDVTLHVGEGLFINARQLHYFYSDEITQCSFICIRFDQVLLCTAINFKGDYVDPIINGGKPYVLLSPEVSWQEKILQSILDINNCKGKPEAPLLIQGSLCTLWGHLFAHMEINEESEKQDDMKLTLLKDMIEYIQQNYAGRIMLEDIAGAGNVSKRTCGTIFQRYLSRTPMEVLLACRLQKAIELLNTTDQTMLEISQAVGFSGASYFAETFRNSFGVSPTEYRKKLRKD